MKRSTLVVFLVVAAVVLSAMPTAIAPLSGCEETVNPHGETIPPAGYTTAPGINPHSGVNDDGFFRIYANATGFDVGTVKITIIDKGADNMVNVLNSSDPVNDDNHVFGPFVFNDTDVAEMKIKYTEANGAEPSIKEMASTKSDNKGQANAIAYHIKGQGDPAWFIQYYHTDGSYFVGHLREACLVPPPPR